MALERLSLAQPAVDADADVVLQPSVDVTTEDASRAPRLPRWTRQEILVLIQGKRVAENRVRRGRTACLGFGSSSGQAEPKWASVSSYCKRHGVNRGPVQCRKRWSNLAGDFKKIKEWESQIVEETESFWVMRNDLRREKKLPGFFDREVYDILDCSSEETPTALALALAPASASVPSNEEEPVVEAVFDSGRSAAADDGLFSDFEQSGQEHTGDSPAKEKEAPTTTVPAPIPISGATPCGKQSPSNPPEVGTSTHEGRKRKRLARDGDEEETYDLQKLLIETLERNGRILSSQLEVQNSNSQLDREQRKDHGDGLIAVLSKLADAIGRIADKL